jgi:phosphoglycolate phosphatase
MAKVIVGNEQLEDVDLFIFDKDGTLIDIHHYWCSMISLRAEYLVGKYFNQNEKIKYELMDTMGVDIELNKIKPEGPVGIKPRTFIIETVYKTLLKHSNTIHQDDIIHAFNEVDKISLQKIDKIVWPLPGIPKILAILKENDIKIALATTDITERAELALSTIKIDHFFDLIVGCDLVKNTKPAPDLVNFITSKLSIKNENAVVVGDAMVDLKMAKNANSKFIGVKTGLYDPDFLKSTNLLVENLNEIRVLR